MPSDSIISTNSSNVAKGYLPLDGIFLAERPFLLFKRPIDGEWASKKQKKISYPKGRFPPGGIFRPE